MTLFGALRVLFFVVVGVGVVVAEGAYAYHRLKNWSSLTGLQKFFAIRDVLAALALLLFLAVLGTSFLLVALEGP